MAGFNFVEAAGKGYQFVWHERRMLTHYGFWPVMLKIASFVLIVSFGLENNLLRQGLVLIPAYVLEGWLVAVAIRYALFGEGTPEPLNSLDPSPAAAGRRDAILGGMLLYLLIRLSSSFFTGLLLLSGAAQPNPEAHSTAGAFFVFTVAIAAALWAFRLFWVHVPVIMGCPIKEYLKAVAGFMSSFNMLALWMICMMPVVMVIALASKVLMIVLPGPSVDVASMGHIYTLAVLQGIMETIVALIASVAMAYGVREVLMKHENIRY